jgi:hypothetical protein
MGSEEDMPPGEKLVTCFRPFVEYLVRCADLSPKTIQRHVDHLWVLGGEIIRDLNETPSLREKNIEQILVDVIDDEGGPLVYGISSSNSSGPLIPPAVSFTDSSARFPAEPANHPQIPRTRRNDSLEEIVGRFRLGELAK